MSDIQQVTFKVIGIMSGTSLDGVDLAYCEFTQTENQAWQYKIIAAQTIAYNQTWLTRIKELPNQTPDIYVKTDVFYGKYLGQLVNDFIAKHNLKVDFIASHGHTIFHQPHNGFTAQIGCGANIYAQTGITTINNFRVVDVALGGQGAPLVPIGDELLFTDYDACLNLGGFSNISFKQNNNRVAFDIGPCNIITNPVANHLGFDFDDEGKLAASGKVNNELLEKLNKLDYYKKAAPKSLGMEWVEKEIWPTVNVSATTGVDLLATFNLHIAEQIAAVIKLNKLNNVIVTGGGAFNTKLISTINNLVGFELHLPSSQIINYKEALIFAFLGVLRITNQNNAIKEVTGAKNDSINGAVWGEIKIARKYR